jgi:DNA-binding transcriptional LysR family regulator
MNYSEIDLNVLLILDALYDTGSTTLVAERLKVSQPTVSFSLGKLRDVFGDELFVRHGASMQPTPLAESIREPVRRVIETVRFDILRERAFDPASAERTFSLSASDIGELVFLPRWVSVQRHCCLPLPIWKERFCFRPSWRSRCSGHPASNILIAG